MDPPEKQFFVAAGEASKTPVAAAVLELALFDNDTKKFLKENNVVQLKQSQPSMIRLGVDINAVLELLKDKFDKVAGAQSTRMQMTCLVHG